MSTTRRDFFLTLLTSAIAAGVPGLERLVPTRTFVEFPRVPVVHTGRYRVFSLIENKIVYELEEDQT